jgi:hypothetical protein
MGVLGVITGTQTLGFATPASWTQALAWQEDNTNGQFTQVFYYPNNPGSITSVPLKNNNLTTANCVCIMLELSGIGITSPLDGTSVHAVDTIASTFAVTSPSATTAWDAFILFASMTLTYSGPVNVVYSTGLNCGGIVNFPTTSGTARTSFCAWGVQQATGTQALDYALFGTTNRTNYAAIALLGTAPAASNSFPSGFGEPEGHSGQAQMTQLLGGR